MSTHYSTDATHGLWGTVTLHTRGTELTTSHNTTQRDQHCSKLSASSWISTSPRKIWKVMPISSRRCVVCLFSGCCPRVPRTRTHNTPLSYCYSTLLSATLQPCLAFMAFNTYSLTHIILSQHTLALTRTLRHLSQHPHTHTWHTLHHTAPSTSPTTHTFTH